LSREWVGRIGAGERPRKIMIDAEDAENARQNVHINFQYYD
jgi:hypothetical protein